MNALIKNMMAREIFDSRGNPTIEVDCLLSDGTLGRASVPSGASTGENEAVELRDVDNKRLGGKGVLEAVKHVHNEIASAVIGCSPFDQTKIDNLLIQLDGTENKSRLGANAILGASMAICRAAALSQGIPLYRYIGGMDAEIPRPFFNVINGGKHADSGIDIQEFLITPVAATSFREGMERIVNVYHVLKNTLEKAGYATSLGDEGGFAPKLKSSKEALDFLMESIKQAGYQPGKDVAIAMDPAASEFYTDGHYHFEGKQLNSQQMIEYYEQLIHEYPIISIEDPLSEHDWDSWREMTHKLGNIVQLVGDDIFVTNPKIFTKGISEQIGNSILIKLNQIGTITESIQTIRLARKHGYSTMISHRSGETEDTFIADFAAGMAAGQIKTGSVARTERVAKYNQFLRIEEQLL
ncbi:phosphopyruvate hydratase [Paenibacillus polymyxa]|uniref:phosphopyruvate hydratase n=1 Tax=Paenibacillus polymyxa TaxID=1406 RepID=UPI001BEB8F1A|nr:phosphopyruvate hydratase [Paenibacillus polymyxa]MBT2282512.1 phosphopyruvate hydratase [Paenibacillus polymyxa]